ncbi:MAG: metal-dependent hydrolase [Alphaproteobacteria bacterium]|nr:MAG: metal-dependent hydrolase [Alphaproteobacteria bacterium]
MSAYDMAHSSGTFCWSLYALPMTESITPRRFVASLPPDIPKHWLPGNELVSSLLNAYTILVPANESFYIRTIQACLDHVEDDALRARCKRFVYQEAQHGSAHMRYWTNLDAQGYQFRDYEHAVDRYVFRVIERATPAWFRVSAVAAVEHINAYMAEEFLAQDILAAAEPNVRDLMEWHFAEEIEHRSVAFDLLQAVEPSYIARIAGFGTTVVLFYGLMGTLAVRLLAQDGLLWRRRTGRQLRDHLWSSHHMPRKTIRHVVDYLRPGFHPSQSKIDGFARLTLERLERTTPPKVVPTQRG